MALTMTHPENTGRDQAGRWRKGASGNRAGKPRGARHKATLAAETLLETIAADALTASFDSVIAGNSKQTGRSLRGGTMRSRHSLRADTSPLSASSTAFRLRASASPSK